MRFAIAVALSIAAMPGFATTVPSASAARAAATGNPAPEAALAERVLEPQSVRIEVSATGTVVSATAVPEVPPSIRSILETAVRGWQFSPRQRDGVAMASWVIASISLTAVPIEDQYRLRVTHVRIVDYMVGKMTPPQYPVEALRAGRDATVCLQVQVNNGVQSIAGLWVNGKPAAKGDGFAISVRKAMTSWHVKSADPMDPPYDGTAMIPVTFTAGRTIDGKQIKAPEAANPHEDRCKGLMPEAVGQVRLLSTPEGALL